MEISRISAAASASTMYGLLARSLNVGTMTLSSGIIMSNEQEHCRFRRATGLKAWVWRAQARSEPPLVQMSFGQQKPVNSGRPTGLSALITDVHWKAC